MKRIIVLLIVIIGLFSCGKKELKVPKVAMKGAEEVANHSTIWFFYGEKGTLDVNEKNRISSTHWFFNVDKRLKLRQIIPEANRLLIKHNKKSPHNTEPMNNYFTYVNSLNDHLSFYQFDSIRYKLIKPTALPQFKSDTILLKINDANIHLPMGNEGSIIQVVYDGNMPFQDYFSAKAMLKKLILEAYISKYEYILID